MLLQMTHDDVMIWYGMEDKGAACVTPAHIAAVTVSRVSLEQHSRRVRGAIGGTAPIWDLSLLDSTTYCMGGTDAWHSLEPVLQALKSPE